MKIRKLRNGELQFYCEGCQHHHTFNHTWNFNQDFNHPTIHPSILVRGTEPITDEELQLVMDGVKINPKPLVCHSFIKEGKIQYLGDCTHHLKNQTVELQEVKDFNYDD